MTATIELDETNFDREVGRGRFLLDLTAPRCGPCRVWPTMSASSDDSLRPSASSTAAVRSDTAGALKASVCGKISAQASPCGT